MSTSSEFLRNLTVRLILWGSEPITFFGGILLGTALNMITGLSLFTVEQWPENGIALLAGSVTFCCSSIALAALAWHIRPWKPRADKLLSERDKFRRDNEKYESDESFLWTKLIDVTGHGREVQSQLLRTLLVACGLFLVGLALFVRTLPVFAR